ncbi:sirohydrochlorin chelatase [Amycolatopsis sp. BJA-103]|uniref:sirohydrochlorin chelatase n=1 Tax=Amycolatopsis sp. BJA-103 TaxID=1911175 RepID=UPI000C794DD6|nr:sirohydrochlorin chelatase [Amycolatopsis sp. BJA-103]AUI57162.1 sirohydrochlorin chelatase [Amycolatopsis sp. BJA-103]PNE15439.1 sirohydrochlorin chelatase [Amycolatopsis sp. BJA-103]
MTPSRTPPLVAVAHGSRDPRSAATIRALLDVSRGLAPGLDIRESFLDLSEPLLTDALRGLYAEGHREVVVVPLLLGVAYHARVDLPALVAEATADCPGLDVRVSGVLGIDPIIETVALDRLTEAGADLDDPGLGVLLAGVGSSNVAANDAVAGITTRWHLRRGLLATPAFASAAQPDVPAAIARLRLNGARRLAVAGWFLAPGLLPDRIARLAREADPSVIVAGPLGPDPRIAGLVLDRYDVAAARLAA